MWLWTDSGGVLREVGEGFEGWNTRICALPTSWACTQLIGFCFFGFFLTTFLKSFCAISENSVIDYTLLLCSRYPSVFPRILPGGPLSFWRALKDPGKSRCGDFSGTGAVHPKSVFGQRHGNARRADVECIFLLTLTIGLLERLGDLHGMWAVENAGLIFFFFLLYLCKIGGAAGTLVITQTEWKVVFVLFPGECSKDAQRLVLFLL